MCFQVPGNVIRCVWGQRCHGGQCYGGDLSRVTRSLLWGLFVLSLFVCFLTLVLFTWATKPTTLNICSSLSPAEASASACWGSDFFQPHKNIRVCVCTCVCFSPTSVLQVNPRSGWPRSAEKPERHIIPLPTQEGAAAFFHAFSFFPVCIHHFVLNMTKIIHRAVSLLLFRCWLERRPRPPCCFHHLPSDTESDSQAFL